MMVVVPNILVRDAVVVVVVPMDRTAENACTPP
jgi:hypothetical protein